MKVDVLLGLQWGDEGKGKIVDVVTPHYDIIARFQGGPNAGHTLEFNQKKIVLHTIPSGIFRDHNTNLIGNGVVIDPITLKKEIQTIEAFGVVLNKKLYISKKAHLILPSHRMIDAAQESLKGSDKIGSTLKGIGPTYSDKIGRNGLRVGDIMEADFQQRLTKILTLHKKTLDQLGYDYSELDAQLALWLDGLETIKQFPCIDAEYFLQEQLSKNKKVLAEGAQGTLLDIDFGSYPYVTSSNTICAGACTGLGVSPKQIGEVIGIFKAYCTRVGSGPFPTELHDELGESIRQKGREFGSTTGRARRCGWLDLPALKYAIMINGVSRLMMMKADVLSEIPEIKACTAYNTEGHLSDQIPFRLENKMLSPVYQSFNGWSSTLTDCASASDLPPELLSYVKWIEKETQVPIDLVSCGPDRAQTIYLT